MASQPPSQDLLFRSTPPQETGVVARGVPASAPPRPKLAAKQERALRKAPAPPPLSDLGPVSERGRYHALKLNRGWTEWFETPSSDCYNFAATTPEAILGTIGPVLGSQGYGMSFSEDLRRESVMLRPIGHDLPTGVFIFEKGLLADHRETGRRGRRIVIGVAIAVVIGIAGLLGYAYLPGPNGNLGLLALPVGFGVALGIGLQGANANYWSDVALVAYFAKGASAKHGLESSLGAADFQVYVTLGRAQSQDWFSKTGSGRFIQTLLPSAFEDSTRVLIRTAITGI